MTGPSYRYAESQLPAHRYGSGGLHGDIPTTLGWGLHTIRLGFVHSANKGGLRVRFIITLRDKTTGRLVFAWVLDASLALRTVHAMALPATANASATMLYDLEIEVIQPYDA